MKVLVTGSSGFIGFHLCKRLLCDGHSVIGIDNMNDFYDPGLKYERLKILEKYDQFPFIEMDIININCKTFEGIDVVINLAAQASTRLQKKYYSKYDHSNINGFSEILKMIIRNKIKMFVYASSSSVYNSNCKLPFSEEEKKLEPLTYYGKTKYQNEKKAEKFSIQCNVSCIGLRFFTVYGEYGRPDMAYYKFANHMLKNEEIKIFNYGNTMRDMTHISDVVEAICLSLSLLKKSSQKNRITNKIFNVGTGRSIRMSYLLEELKKNLDIDKINLSYEKAVEISETKACLNEIHKILGYNPSVSFEDGLKSFSDWIVKTKYKV